MNQLTQHGQHSSSTGHGTQQTQHEAPPPALPQIKQQRSESTSEAPKEMRIISVVSSILKERCLCWISEMLVLMGVRYVEMQQSWL